jgi:hypothetical protein
VEGAGEGECAWSPLQGMRNGGERWFGGVTVKFCGVVLAVIVRAPRDEDGDEDDGQHESDGARQDVQPELAVRIRHHDGLDSTLLLRGELCRAHDRSASAES